MSSADDCPVAASKCNKCQIETNLDNKNLCSACKSPIDIPSTVQQQNIPGVSLKMEIDVELKTTDSFIEINDTANVTPVTSEQTIAKEQLQQHDVLTENMPVAIEPQPEIAATSPLAIKEEPKTAPDVEIIEIKMAPSSATGQAPPRRLGGTAGKVTRGSLNGTPSPTIIKRLRKSTRSTRFKAKITGRGSGTSGVHTSGVSNGLVDSTGMSITGHQVGSSTHAGGKALGKVAAGNAGSISGARNRRTIFKRPAQKTPRMQASTRFTKSLFYKGVFMQIGDVVSIVDSEHNVYYAQIRGLLVDAYCEKSAFLTWLIPTQDSPDPKDGFDPATYLIGPVEELSRKLCYLEFVMHAPSNYYYDRTTPFPLPDTADYTCHKADGYIWTRLPTVKRER